LLIQNAFFYIPNLLPRLTLQSIIFPNLSKSSSSSLFSKSEGNRPINKDILAIYSFRQQGRREKRKLVCVGFFFFNFKFKEPMPNLFFVLQHTIDSLIQSMKV
jgi:hypothetical protein